MIISNTTPLIHLGKVGKLTLLKDCFGKITVPVEVLREIRAVPGSAESILAEQAASAGWLISEQVERHPKLEHFQGLDPGELKAITLALHTKLPLLIDDNVAKAVARLFGVEVHGTLYVLLRAYKSKLLSKPDTIAVVKAMMRNEFYLSSEVYALFLELLEQA